VTGLRALLCASAEAMLARQRPDGSLPAGHNGLYRDAETPVRNTGHWLVSWLAALRWTGDARYRRAAEQALGYLASEKARPGGASFWHRDAAGKDACNGLIGQAWSIEALVTAADVLELEEPARLAEQVFLLHPFDESLGLWRALEIDGRCLHWDATFNHQLWFAAAGALLAGHASPEVARRVARFLERLPRLLGVHGDGLIRHWLAPAGLLRRAPRRALRLLRGRRREAAALRRRELGYHAFNLYAFALLRRHAPDHAIWRQRRFRHAWRFARSPCFRQALEDNPYGWAYNPVGIEMAFALETFEGPGSRAEQAIWLGLQLVRHWDFAERLLSRDTPDPATLAARLYEAARLPNLALPWPDAPAQVGAPRRR